MNTWILLGAALLPAIVLCVYIFKKDSGEKEPLGLLILLLGAGVVICYPVVLCERWIGEIINQTFGSMGVVQDGQVFLASNTYHMYLLAKNIIGVAMVEEGFKFLAMWILTRNNRNFNYLFDGIVYAVFVSLGFAGFENILYVFDYGFQTALLRMVTAVPAHAFFAVLMGYYYSQWHVLEIAKGKENRYISIGVLLRRIERISNKKYLILAVVVPTLVHGFYDYCCSVSEVWATLVFIGLMVFLYIYCFAKVKQMSQTDVSDVTAADAVLIRKYPQLQEYYRNLREQRMANEYGQTKSFY